jgi:outer membrane protein assembly factor BamD
MFTPRILPDRSALRIGAVPALLILLSACATVPADRGAAQDSPRGLYEAGNQALESGDYPEAIRHFQHLEALFPNDQYTTRGGMELVFSYYQAGDPASAIAAAGRFIRAHPDHPNIDYLYYLRGLARFDQAMFDLSAIEGTTGPRPPTVDLALQYFGELIGRYPRSHYSDDARNRIRHLRQQLATFELEAAKQHLNRGEYTSAGLRARSVIEHYPDTGLATDAATVVNMANRMLNLEGAARESLPQAPIEAGAHPAGQADDGAAPDTDTSPATAPPPPAEAISDGAAPEPRNDGPHREDWIAQQNADAWTIQLFSTGNEQALLNFVEHHKLEDAAYYRVTRDDKLWYSLIYGAFTDIDAARAAAERLPRAVLGERPWIRNFSGVQAIITLEDLEQNASP